MDKTFKEKVEEIVHEQIYKVTGCKDLKAGELYLSKELTEAILSAHNAELDRITKELNLIRNPYTGIKDQCPDVYRKFNKATSNQRTADKAYIQAQKGS